MYEESIETQRIYLKQLIQRYQKDVYDKYNLVFTHSDWEPIAHVYHETNKVKCDFVKPNGNRCGHLIKNEHIFKKKNSDKMISLGIVCVSKMLGTSELTGKEKRSIEKDLNKLNEIEELFKKIIENREYMNSRGHSEKFTKEEKELIINKAKNLNIFPVDFIKLEKAEIPLTNQQLSYLEKNSANVISRQKNIDKMYKEKENWKNQSKHEFSSENDYQYEYTSRHESENSKDSNFINQSLKKIKDDYDERIAALEHFEDVPYYIDVESGEIDNELKVLVEIIDCLFSKNTREINISHRDIFNMYFDINKVEEYREKQEIITNYFFSVTEYIVVKKMLEFSLSFIYLSFSKEAFIVVKCESVGVV